MIETRRARGALVVALALALLPLQAARATAPLAMDRPIVELAAGGKISAAAIPIRVSWPPAPATGSPVSHYTLEINSDAAGWLPVSLSRPLAGEVTVRLRPWLAHAFRVRATYADGASTDWGATGPIWLGGVDEADPSVSYQHAWAMRSDSSADGGARASSATAGAAASYAFAGSSIGWVSARGPDHGRARVYVDDVHVATVDLRRARRQPRRVVFSASFATPAERTLRIEVEGTIGRPRVDVDGFVTLAPPATATLVGAGDIGRCGNASVGDTAELVMALGSSAIVYTTGDNAYPNGTSTDFAECYDPTWGAFRQRTRPSPGNHDNVYGLGAYFDYFGPHAGPPGRGYYAYEAGTWRIYSLNSESCRRSNSWCAPGSAQYEWLRADLLARPHRCVLAYWHRPRFSSGYHGGSTRMAHITALLHARGAEIVLAGHDHGYERLAPTNAEGTLDAHGGIRQFVIGTGGAALYEYTKPPLATTVVRQAHVHGVLRLELGLGSYAWDFLPVQEGAFSDSGSSVCH